MVAPCCCRNSDRDMIPYSKFSEKCDSVSEVWYWVMNEFCRSENSITDFIYYWIFNIDYSMISDKVNQCWIFCKELINEIRGVISTFSLGGQNFFIIFQCHRTIEKLGKKQHFICSNLTLFIVSFFLSFFFFFFSLFSFFSFFFSFSLGERRPPSPPQMMPLNEIQS